MFDRVHTDNILNMVDTVRKKTDYTTFVSPYFDMYEFEYFKPKVEYIEIDDDINDDIEIPTDKSRLISYYCTIPNENRHTFLYELDIQCHLAMYYKLYTINPNQTFKVETGYYIEVDIEECMSYIEGEYIADYTKDVCIWSGFYMINYCIPGSKVVIKVGHTSVHDDDHGNTIINSFGDYSYISCIKWVNGRYLLRVEDFIYLVTVLMKGERDILSKSHLLYYFEGEKEYLISY